jgi:hypothetical protein
MLQRKSKHNLCNIYIYIFFPRKCYRLGDNVENYCSAGQTRDDNMAHAHYMLDT